MAGIDDFRTLFRPQNQHIGGIAGEYAVFEYAGDFVDFIFHRQRLIDIQAVDIDDLVAVKRGVADTQFGLSAHGKQFARNKGARAFDGFHGQWEFAQPGNIFAFVRNADEFF